MDCHEETAAGNMVTKGDSGGSSTGGKGHQGDLSVTLEDTCHHRHNVGRNWNVKYAFDEEERTQKKSSHHHTVAGSRGDSAVRPHGGDKLGCLAKEIPKPSVRVWPAVFLLLSVKYERRCELGKGLLSKTEPALRPVTTAETRSQGFTAGKAHALEGSRRVWLDNLLLKTLVV